MNEKPNPLEVALVMLFILITLGFVGGLDYQDEIERENRTLRAAAARCQLAMDLRGSPLTPAHSPAERGGDAEARHAQP